MRDDQQPPYEPLPLIPRRPAGEAPRRPSWAEVMVFEHRTTHCKFCGDAIVRAEDRHTFEQWPNQVVCPDCEPAARLELLTERNLVRDAGRIPAWQVCAIIAIGMLGAYAGLLVTITGRGW